MVMGTASDVGKSVVVTGLCRLLARAGVRVAPFKSQNMSNNAAVCRGGGEIGRAQAVQGDAGLLADGLRIIEDRTGVPVLGILPYVGDLDIPQEDSASLKTGTTVQDQRPISVGVVRFPGISNHTDFAPLAREPDVDLQYFDRPEHVGHVDILCLPGSKNTIADLHWLRECGWDGRISAHYRGGGSIVGICGGYQMLGHVIGDPYHVESSASAASG